jgi:hypothetical protein
MRSSNRPATSLCKIVYEVSGGSVLSERSAFQVSASGFPDGLRSLACWKAASALRKLSPFLPSISPGAKPSRSSSTSVLTMIAGSLLAHCGAAPLMDSDVNAATWEDDPCLGCLCVAASAAAKENNAMKKVAIGITLIIRQLSPYAFPFLLFDPSKDALDAVWPHGQTWSAGPGLSACPRKRTPHRLRCGTSYSANWINLLAR